MSVLRDEEIESKGATINPNAAKLILSVFYDSILKEERVNKRPPDNINAYCPPDSTEDKERKPKKNNRKEELAAS